MRVESINAFFRSLWFSHSLGNEAGLAWLVEVSGYGKGGYFKSMAAKRRTNYGGKISYLPYTAYQGYPQTSNGIIG